MKKLVICLLACTVVSLISCNSAESGDTAEAMRRYGIKSLCIKYKVKGDMFAGAEELYFDDWGAIEAKYSNHQVRAFGMNQDNESVTFTEGATIYTYNPKQNTGTRAENPILKPMLEQHKDIKELGKEMMVQLDGKKIGTGKVLDKDCDIWEIASMGTRTWVWNWINLKTETNTMGMKMTIEATEISETFDKKKLQKPNVEYKDMGDMLKGLDALKKGYKPQ